jgi:hypothetical protein
LKDIDRRLAVHAPMQPGMFAAFTQFNDKINDASAPSRPIPLHLAGHPTASGRLALAPFPFCRPSLSKTNNPDGIQSAHPS